MKIQKIAILSISEDAIDENAKLKYVITISSNKKQISREFDKHSKGLHQMARWLKVSSVDAVVLIFKELNWMENYLLLEKYDIPIIPVSKYYLDSKLKKANEDINTIIQQICIVGLTEQFNLTNDLFSDLKTFYLQRSFLQKESRKQIRSIQDTLEKINIRIDKVFSRIESKRCMDIIGAITLGERNSETLSKLVYAKKQQESYEVIEAANWKEDGLFILRQAYELYQVFQAKIQECDEKIKMELKKINQNYGQYLLTKNNVQEIKSIELRKENLCANVPMC